MAERRRTILVLNQISANGLKRLPAERYRGRQGRRRSPTRCWCARPTCTAWTSRPACGDRPRRRRHQQHPGRGDERARRAGVQRARRQRQRGQGTGARRHADGRAQPAAGAALRRRARPADAPTWTRRSKTARRPSPASSWPGQTLGIVGLGKIGCLVADAAIKLGMHVLGYDPEITVDAAWSLPAQVQARRQRGRGAARQRTSSRCTCRWSRPRATWSTPTTSR